LGEGAGQGKAAKLRGGIGGEGPEGGGLTLMSFHRWPWMPGERSVLLLK
jgi:hypothetical protein